MLTRVRLFVVLSQVDAKKKADLGGSGIDSILQRAMANRKSMFDRT
jgi:hypothetical protein